MKLKDQVAVVTGGGRGIGRATAIALAEQGAHAVVIARNKKEVSETVDKIKKVGRKSVGILADVRDSKKVKQAIDEVIKQFGRIDILVNNAGVAVYKPLTETTEEEWNTTIDTNLKGIYLFAYHALPQMIKQRSGIIINISSGAGKHGFPNFAAYCASKFGAIGLTESVAQEVEKYGIKVFAVCPGGVNTKMYRDLFPEDDPNKLVQPEEVANIILKLCMPTDKTKTGSAVNVYGGIIESLKKYKKMKTV